MNWLWLSGWAIEPAWFERQAQAAFPDATHTAVSPLNAKDAIVIGSFDAIGGYSLGSLWLLRNVDIIPSQKPVLLLAPIFAFPTEAGLGGRIPLAQLQLQRRRTKNDVLAALSEFSHFSGIESGAFSSNSLDWNTASLDTGLACLTEWHAPAPTPPHWKGFVGSNDTLLDAFRLKELWPDITIIENAGHAPGPLLRAAAKQLNQA